MLYRVYPLYILLFLIGNSRMLSMSVFEMYYQQAILRRQCPAEGPTSIGDVDGEKVV